MSPNRTGILLGIVFSSGVLGAVACASRGEPEAGGGAGPAGRHGPPQVIRTVDAEVEVGNVPRAVRALRRAVAHQEGWIASATVHHADGGDASAVVQARVPAAKLDRLRAEVARLGELQSEQEQAQDVADQLVDLDARLRNARAEEAMLLGLLERSGSLADVLAVERELAARRESIERMAAEQAGLREQVEYASVTVHVATRSVAFWEEPGESIAASARVGVDLAAALAVGSVSAAAAIGPSALMALAALALLVLAVRLIRRRGPGPVAAS